MRNAVIPPFNLDTLRRTAIGQFGAQIDKIRELHDVETFHDTVDAYIEALPRLKPQKEDELPDFVSRVIGSRCVPDSVLRLSSLPATRHNDVNPCKLAYITPISSLRPGKSSGIPCATCKNAA